MQWGVLCDDNRDNLRQFEVVFCGRNGNALKYYCPRIIGKYFFCPRIARMDTNGCNGLNGDRVGRTNLHECNKFFIYMSCDVLPFFEIFGCARHSPNKYSFALACTKIRAICGQKYFEAFPLHPRQLQVVSCGRNRQRISQSLTRY